MFCNRVPYHTWWCSCGSSTRNYFHFMNYFLIRLLGIRFGMCFLFSCFSAPHASVLFYFSVFLLLHVSDFSAFLLLCFFLFPASLLSASLLFRVLRFLLLCFSVCLLLCCSFCFYFFCSRALLLLYFLLLCFFASSPYCLCAVLFLLLSPVFESSMKP